MTLPTRTDSSGSPMVAASRPTSGDGRARHLRSTVRQQLGSPTQAGARIALVGYVEDGWKAAFSAAASQHPLVIQASKALAGLDGLLDAPRWPATLTRRASGTGRV